MREALAKSDLDFVTRGDAGASGSGNIEIARLPRILRVAAISTSAVVCAVIVVNALFLQDRKHAAPILRPFDRPAEASLPPPSPAPRAQVQPAQAPPVSTPASAPRGAARDPIADELSRVAVAPERKDHASLKPAAAKSDKSDAIANLIGSGASAAATPTLNTQTVQATQKALVRLGYVLRTTGVADAATKHAIERYERDNKLPVHGALTARLARDIANRVTLASQ